MKQDRPSFRAYRAHIYRQYFGRSLSVKPINGRNYWESYAILKSMPYKLFWIVFIPLMFIITFTQGFQFGLIPLLAALGLYFIVSIIRYFFAGFVKLEESEFISYEMCDNASKDVRPKFSAYLKYIFVPTRSRYKHIIKDADGREYYRNQRIQRRFYPESFSLYALGYFIAKMADVMGIWFFSLSWLVIGALFLLLSPLSLYFLRFKSIDNQDYTLLEDDEPYSVLYKIFSGIFICAGLAVIVLGVIFIRGSQEREEINFTEPQTIEQAYNYSLAYVSDSFEKTDVIDFHIKYNDINAMHSGKPSNWFITFQNTPGLLPRPNETMEFSAHKNNISVYHRTYETIERTYAQKLVTDPAEILAILMSKGIISSDSNISAIVITTADRSMFKIHDPEECKVEIEIDGQETVNYIVNIRGKTVRLG